MSIARAVHESLPCEYRILGSPPRKTDPKPVDVDKEPTSEQRAAAEALIASELASLPEDAKSTIPSLYEPQFSPIIASELERIAAKKPLKAIDLSRYQELEAPSDDTPMADLQPTLARAYTANTYLSSRHTHLSLLDQFGKNAWLVSNWQTESELAALERDLADVKREIDMVNIARRRAQDESAAEIRGLDESWRRGVGRVIETETAVGELRREVLERRRQAA
jgi:pre-mRNA-splicing factor SPF27